MSFPVQLYIQLCVSKVSEGLRYDIGSHLTLSRAKGSYRELSQSDPLWRQLPQPRWLQAREGCTQVNAVHALCNTSELIGNGRTRVTQVNRVLKCHEQVSVLRRVPVAADTHHLPVYCPPNHPACQRDSDSAPQAAAAPVLAWARTYA